MNRIKLGRPSPALVIACISLFVALGGVGYAAATGSIDGREVKNNSIASKDLKNSSIVGKDVKTSGLTGSDVKANSLTGSDIAESGLGKVPSAGQADNAATAGNATTAGNANTVGGVTVKSFATPLASGTTTPTPIASLNGFTLLATCSGGLALTMDTTKENTQVQYSHVNGANAPVAGRVEIDAATAPTDVDEGHDNGTGTFTAATGDGKALTVTMSFDTPFIFGQNACGFEGTAVG